MKDPNPLEHYYPELAKDPSVKEALKRLLGKPATAVLRQMRNGDPLGPERSDVADALSDLINDDAIEAKTFYAEGSDGCFPIEIMELGPVFFIRATEFDDIGYFGSEADATAHAEAEYEPYGPFSDDPDDDDWDEEEEEDAAE